MLTQLGLPPDMPSAVCAQADPDLWHPRDTTMDDDPTGGSTSTLTAAFAEAKALCQKCQHQEECLEWALATGQRFGVWGGLGPKERERLLDNRRRGRGLT